ncbi:MAG: dihydrodipicolinate synthase family protein [Deltaproteobacteria bacterium]|nr:dihydrodipicolinate synthase family protein [Deltaproteobacteria bacterium]MBW1950358.1 dihydrodipicolinate synthase family protein [Deltaproteobacteria bacterium]MBW2008096.1 dihydrodipicolinate synthase family protein [Deltaproteobacteria bacterium]MBW2348993.1 dihydrodipicolinate synthase family protein [Deltaproteobacteria bacterium]
MAPREAPRGLIVDLVTPLRDDLTIDAKGLEMLLARVSPHAQGLLLAGPRGGEGAKLNEDQRRMLLEETLSMTCAELPLFVWITGSSVSETRHTLTLLSETVERKSFPALSLFWVDTPLYYHSNRGLEAHFRELARITGHPFILHNDPVRVSTLGRPLKRKNIRTEILKDLCGLEFIAGMIYEGTPERSRHYLRAVRAGTRFRLYDGDEARFLDHPSRSGVVSLGANLAPGPWQKITASSLHLNGERKIYPDHLSQLWETGRYLHDLAVLCRALPVSAIRQVLFKTGLFPPTQPTPPEGTQDAVRRLEELMRDHGDFPP